MTQASGAMAVFAGVATVATGGPLAQVLNETTLLMAIAGTSGGVTLGLSIKGTPWRDVARNALLGSLLATGVGVLGPQLLERMIGVELAEDNTSAPFVAGVSYLIGYFQERLFAMSKGTKK